MLGLFKRKRQLPPKTIELKAEPVSEPTPPVQASPQPPKRKLQPPISKRDPIPLKRRPPEEHAAALVKWLQSSAWHTSDIESKVGAPIADRDLGIVKRGTDETGRRFAEVLQVEISDCYQEMCGELAWYPIKWNTLAQHLKTETADKKRYANVLDDEGQPRKLRVYRIPMPEPKQAAKHDSQRRSPTPTSTPHLTPVPTPRPAAA